VHLQAIYNKSLHIAAWCLRRRVQVIGIAPHVATSITQAAQYATSVASLQDLLGLEAMLKRLSIQPRR